MLFAEQRFWDEYVDMKKLEKTVKTNLLRNDRGNVSVIFALSVTTVIIAIGAAIDYSSLEQRDNILQNAADSAVLAAALSGETRLPELKKISESVFDQNFEYNQNESLKDFNLELSNDGILTLDVEIKKPTVFMKFAGIPEVFAQATSASNLQSETPLDIALVLDRTGSMAGSNLNGLISAAGQFITDIEASNRDIRIAVVPFSDYVNVGTHHSDMSWLDLPSSGGTGSDVECSMQSQSTTTCPSVSWSTSGSGSSSTSTTTTTSPSTSTGTSSSSSTRTTSSSSSCGTVSTRVATESRTSGGTTTTTTTTTTTYSGSCSGSTATGSGGTTSWSDVFSGSSGALCTISPDPQDNSGSLVEECRPRNTAESWFGCVGSRPAPYNAQAGYDGQKFPVVYNRTCGQAITELTDSYSAVRQKISDLTASGTTYIPAGLQWGWRVLDKDVPFETNETQSRQKLLILMTDGQNNRSQSGTLHTGTDYAAANNFTLSLCDNIKASDIKIATVLYSNRGSAVTADQVLTNCASSSDLSFTAGNQNSLRKAFESATDKMNETRLIR